jgi:hypothetical protein
MKLTFQDIYRYVKNPEEAELVIKKWLVWADRSQIEPVKILRKLLENTGLAFCVISSRNLYLD